MRYLSQIFTKPKFISVIYGLTAGLLMALLLSYHPSDPCFNLSTTATPQNILSYPGAYLADLLYQIFGFAAYLFPTCLAAWGILKWLNIKLLYWWLRFLIMFGAAGFISYLLNPMDNFLLPNSSGGVTGVAIDYTIAHYIYSILPEYQFLVDIFIYIITITLTLIALNIPFAAYEYLGKKLWYVCGQLKQQLRLPNQLKHKFNQLETAEAYYAANEFGHLKPKTTQPPNIIQPEINITPPTTKPVEASIITPKPEVPASESTFKKPVNSTATISKSNFSEALPDVELLDAASNQQAHLQTPAELNQQAEKLLQVLNDFGVKGQIVNVRQGPVVTMYEFEPAAGTKSSRVIGLADDIARTLSAISTRIAVIPGRNALGIELPNKQRLFFRLKELIQTKQFNNSSIALPLILGKDLGGEVLIADLAKMPHLLVAGTTGSGKSVAINAMIMSLLYRYTPADCRMIMIDPKMLELSAYDNIPHLLTPVVTEPSKAVVALKWAVKEMESRYRLMSHLGVRNINNYNAKLAEAVKQGQILERKVQTGFDPETGKPIHESVPIDTQKMPFIVVIVDEMADLMLVAGKDIESSIQRLAQMARAAGIHIIMATQRPSVDVITGVIKANFPSRISFKVTSKIDSRTILGEQGAEQLLGMGDMLYMGNSSRILRVHGPFVDDQEVEKVTNYLRSTAMPDYISAVTEDNDDPLAEFADAENDGDDLYRQAINIVKNERKCSISYIQRSLRIGYNRAANLVEEMQRQGVLSEPGHGGKREILLPED